MTDAWLREYEGGLVSERELACPACGHCWHADGYTEYGAWMPEREDDAYCPECGCEGDL